MDSTERNLRLMKAAPALLAVLEEALDFIADQEDTRDGVDGQPFPNRAMYLAHEIRNVIGKATGVRP